MFRLGGIKEGARDLNRGLKSFFSREYFRKPLMLWLLALVLASNIADWVLLLIFIKPVDLPLILHYNVYFGVDMVGNWKQVYVLPAIGFFLFLVNLLLSLYFYKNKERIAAYLLLLASLLIQLSLLIAAASVIIINY